MGFLEVLTLVFVVLKLTGTIDWSWWAVTSPLWGAFLVYAILLLSIVSFSRR